MATPPGRTGVDGPITGRIRAILTARLGVTRLGVTRLGFNPTATQSAALVDDAGAFYPPWREDPEPAVYGPAFSGTEEVAP